LGNRLLVQLIVCALVALVSIGAGSAAPVFKDKTAELGLTLGTGAACWVDVDNDGWVDLVCSNAVWKNNKGKGFTKLADVGGDCVAADFDNDGYADLFNWSSFRLLRNEGGKSFTEFKLPELPRSSPRGACWGDFNKDGFVDLYVGGYEDWDAGITFPDMILMNNKGTSFQLAWSEVKYRARGVTACDFNQDGAVDVYVSNYRLQPNLLWLNDGSGQFKDAAAEYNAVATSAGFEGGHSIGSAWGDFNNDGFIDLFAGNFAHVDGRGDQPKSRFLKNLGPKAKYCFEDMGPCGVFYQESYATPAAGDYDNDGNLDLLFTTVYAGASFGVPNYPVLFRNEGEFKFADVTASAGVAELPPTYQAAWADFNNDGNLDVICGGKLFENQGGDNRWLSVRLSGDGKLVNRSAIGAQVRVRLKDAILTRQVEAGTGEGNQNDLTLHFGLGQQSPTSLEVAWPNGKVQTIRRVRVNRPLTIDYKP